jgi:hypothetical protein
MVLPDTPERDPSRSHRLPALGAVITMSVLAVLVLGRSDLSHRSARPIRVCGDGYRFHHNHAPSMHGPDIEAFTERGRPLNWEGLAGIGGHQPLAIVEVERGGHGLHHPGGSPRRGGRADLDQRTLAVWRTRRLVAMAIPGPSSWPARLA